MQQLEYFALDTSCSACVFDRRQLCIHCFRLRDERDAWEHTDDGEKRAILARSQRRRRAALRNGQAQRTRRSRPVQQFELFPDAQETAAMPVFLSIAAGDDDNPQLALFPEITATIQ
ncbi:MAG: DUF1289 domain-containing protein [Cardiobacteriaceae bacterium]|nr:DUF1289 domain-containing protein [Cardiobacteriaceae bacterium]